MTFVQHDQVVKTFSAYRADQPFDERILPWTSCCRDNLFYAHIFNTLTEIRSVDRVPIPQQIFWHRVPWKRLYNLLGSPHRRGV